MNRVALGRVAFGIAACVAGVAFAVGCNDNNLRSSPPDIAASPGALAFTAGAFAGGATSASLTVIVSNEGGSTLNVSNIAIVSSSAEFGWSTTGGAIPPLPPGGWAAVQVTWTPTDSIVDTGKLVFTSNDPDEPQLELPITTEPVGPALECTPNPVVFIGQPSTPVNRSVTCSNPGTQAITITGMEFAPGSAPEFSGALPAGPVTLNPGDPLPPFDVTFTASALAAFSGQILVHNDGGADYVIELDGTGSDTLPCQLAAVIPWVDFGGVNPGTTSTKPAMVKNNGDVDCHVSAVSIGAITTEFAYGGPQIFTLAPGATKSVNVSYSPIDRIADFGTLLFTSDDPTQAQLGILLTGVGSGPEIDALPCPVDFGLVTVGCKVDRQVTIYNTGDKPLVVSGESLYTASTEFSVPGAWSGSIPPNQTATVGVRLAPSSAGYRSNKLQIMSNDGDEPIFTCQMQGTGTTDDHQTDTFVQSNQPMVDILFIVDNSGSMSSNQQQLGASFTDFANYLISQNVNYHVGVTTTDIDSFTGQHGTLVGNPKIIDTTTANPSSKFAQNANVGTNGDGTERGLEGARMALSPPNTTGANAGFLRQAAKLFLIFVSDEDDQSPDGSSQLQPTSYYSNFFLNVKGNDPSRISASAIAGDVPNGCSTAAAGPRYKEVVDALGGVFSTICTNNFGPALHSIGVNAAQLESEFFLTRQAIASSIVVKVDGAVQAQGTVWTYNATANSIVFASGHVPNPGQTITVDYDVVCN